MEDHNGVLPSIHELADILDDVRQEAEMNADGPIDVRLCVDVDDDGVPTDWELLTGDVQYDTRHYAYCSASFVDPTDEPVQLEQMAEDMLDEIREVMAWGDAWGDA